ncbi:P-loop NTPase [Alicyclobacillus sp. SP_1]|uniref:P-loop NTPase n=1 Tax=Alicyclobacillus sp. SP_1 TaxID=2942475 RepID=UPI0021576C30|nr:P-loop NTPase [Alicyclobacillus sp. SP_1]
MTDQAESLRRRMVEVAPPALEGEFVPRVIVVASGKGGVGKSNFCVNFSLSLSQQGYRPVVVDSDVGFANVELLLDARPTATVLDLCGTADVWDVVQYSKHGLPFLSGGSSLSSVNQLDGEGVQRLHSQLGRLGERFNVVVFDLGAGIGPQFSTLVAEADEMVVVTTPEPTALSDAYALIKYVQENGHRPHWRLVINRARRLVDAKDAAEKLSATVRRFLDLDVQVLGYVLEDEDVQKAVMRQTPWVLSHPNSTATRCMEQIVQNYLRADRPSRGGWTRFLSRLLGRTGDSGGDKNSGHSA